MNELNEVELPYVMYSVLYGVPMWYKASQIKKNDNKLTRLRRKILVG